MSRSKTPPPKKQPSAASPRRPQAPSRNSAASSKTAAPRASGRPSGARSAGASATSRSRSGVSRPSSSRPPSQNRSSASKGSPRAQTSRSPQNSPRPSSQSGGRPPKGVAPSRGSARSSAGKNKGRAPSRRPARRQKLRPRWGRWFLLLALAAALVVGVRAWPFGGADTEAASTAIQAVTTPLVSDADKPGFDATINSDSAILINAGNGDILYEKDADAQRAPASLTKMMTVYVAITHNDDLDRELKMPKEAYEGLEENKASQSGIKAGETVTVRDLLYATLLRSGADAANALALVTSGNIDGFVELMNEEAAHFGLDSTVFTNPTGLDDEKQVSTCRDMARLLKGALGNTTFSDIFRSRSYTTSGGRELTHTMDEDLTTFQRYFDTSGYEIVGGKTGFTNAAGNCLATLAEKEKSPDYIVVTMHATGTGDQYYEAVHDAVTLYGAAYERE